MTSIGEPVGAVFDNTQEENVTAAKLPVETSKMRDDTLSALPTKYGDELLRRTVNLSSQKRLSGYVFST